MRIFRCLRSSTKQGKITSSVSDTLQKSHVLKGATRSGLPLITPIIDMPVKKNTMLANNYVRKIITTRAVVSQRLLEKIVHCNGTPIRITNSVIVCHYRLSNLSADYPRFPHSIRILYGKRDVDCNPSNGRPETTTVSGHVMRKALENISSACANQWLCCDQSMRRVYFKPVTIINGDT